MVRYIDNPPDARSLMTSARSFGNYDLAGALADLIDNSLKARAHNVELVCLFNGGAPGVRVSDDGHGMSEAELQHSHAPCKPEPVGTAFAGRFGSVRMGNEVGIVFPVYPTDGHLDQGWRDLRCCLGSRYPG